MISKEQLAEYKHIYKKEFGEDLSDQEALEQGTRLVNLFKALMKEPITKEKAK